MQTSIISTTSVPFIGTGCVLPSFSNSAIYKYAVKKKIIVDEIEYLRNGCPLVNLTSLADSDYKKIIRGVQNFSGQIYRFGNGRNLEILYP